MGSRLEAIGDTFRDVFVDEGLINRYLVMCMNSLGLTTHPIELDGHKGCLPVTEGDSFFKRTSCDVAHDGGSFDHTKVIGKVVVENPREIVARIANQWMGPKGIFVRIRGVHMFVLFHEKEYSPPSSQLGTSMAVAALYDDRVDTAELEVTGGTFVADLAVSSRF